MNQLLLCGLFAALAVSVNAGFLGNPVSSYGNGGSSVISSGFPLHHAPLATSSITQHRIVHSVPIPTRIIADHSYSGSYGNLGQFGGNGGFGGGQLGGNGGQYGGGNGGNSGLTGYSGNYGSSGNGF